MSVVLGCIADDFTGATDLGNTLARTGLHVVQTTGTPDPETISHADVVIVALKSRTAPVASAVRDSLDALDFLKNLGAKQLYLKICSTFDSTAQGNIGPVAEALMDAMDLDFCCVTPAFPVNGRTVYKGYLFVGDRPLSESGMKDHPLTPMTDSNLVRLLQLQCKRTVGLIAHAVVARGAEAIGREIKALRDRGVGLAIVDALADDDLLTLGRALKHQPLVVAASGVAAGLSRNFPRAAQDAAQAWPAPSGAKAVVSGSCSDATNLQVGHLLSAGYRAFAVDPLRVAAGNSVTEEAINWAKRHLGDQPVLVYATASPAAVQAARKAASGADLSGMVEDVLSTVAVELVRQGVGQLVVAGGETSGSCVTKLKVNRLRIGPEIIPGVPWCFGESSYRPSGLYLALKSGNFGDREFFSSAFKVLQ